MALLSTLAEAASVVTARRAATMGMEARVRRGTARGILTARENMASAAMRSGRIGVKEEGVDDAEDRCKYERTPKDYSSGLLRNSSAPIGYSVESAPIFRHLIQVVALAGDLWSLQVVRASEAPASELTTVHEQTNVY